MADSDNRKELDERALAPDLDATRSGSIPPANLEPSTQPIDEDPTRLADPPQQPMVSPPPAAYSPFPGSSSPAAQSLPPSTPSPETPERNWGIIGVSVLVVVALIALAIGATWIANSKDEANEGEAASQSQSESTQTNTVLETTETATQAPRQAPNRGSAQTGKSIPANAVYEDHGFFTPTRNIGCVMMNDEISCEITKRQWELGCSGGWVSEVSSSGVNSYCNTYDNIGDPQVEAIYGTVYYNGDFACEVGEHTGVNCWNSKTGHGFTMRQADHSTY